jgi:hypothetical protein
MCKSVGSLLIAFVVLVLPHTATAQAALQILWVDPVQGPICAGPMGPGPCQLVAQWIATHGGQSVGIPLPNSMSTTMRFRPGGPMPSIAGIPPLDASVSASASAIAGAAQCAQLTGQHQRPDVERFMVCTRGAVVLNRDSAMLVSCAEQANGSTANLAQCAGRSIIGSKLTQDQMKAVNCATENGDDANDFAECIANNLLANQLTPQQRRLLSCAMNNDVDSREFAACTARALFGDRLSREANAAIDCAIQSQGDFQQFGGCAANKFLNLNLNPEQQIAIQCVISSGGQPYVAAGCAASRLTLRELTKCVEHGIGGDGCFGDNNDLFGRNGFVVRNLAALGGGPNSVIRDPGQVLGGPNSVFNNPRQLLGGPNSVPNQLLRNVPSPPPIEVGKIGNHRVCIPWC